MQVSWGKIDDCDSIVCKTMLMIFDMADDTGKVLLYLYAPTVIYFLLASVLSEKVYCDAEVIKAVVSVQHSAY